jgi:molybdopterin molybdotransferase
VVITSGGVSVGEADFVKSMMERLGEVVFWKIAMKPGRPLAYGASAARTSSALPGNPVSVMVTFYQFVRDALLVLMGADPVAPVPTVQGDLHGEAEEGARSHGVPARRALARRPMACSR